MPWSQNQNNNNNNPWGRGPGGNGNNPPPPDLDELIKRLQERFGGMFGGGSGSGNGGAPALSKSMLSAVVAIALIVWLASGVYMVAADEEAVVLQFGHYEETTTPGLNWHLPFPIETVEKVPVTTVQRLSVGFRDFSDGRKKSMPEESLMLTKDENIVEISFIVQYRIHSPRDFLFNIDSDHAVKTVRDVAESAIREVIGRTMIDDVLTEKKAEVEIETQQLIQQILDSYQSGISITTVKLSDVQPPERVINEFKDVASAREDRERTKNEAQAYANDIIPKARGESKKMVLDAEGYSKEVVDRAKGEADRFDNLLAAYQKAPEVTRKRMYLDTMQEVLSKADKTIIDGSVADKVLPYLPLDRRMNKVEVK
ncbi:MAG: FtsH protease activity modulator HflK [Zetaproteobacteria bacterium CG_4_9_14_3_um_filter_49_83]|nr:MAG: HflK protein [Zetaproteobacteria bacterium CG1_02_49_23]PIQ33926.1 MAG: FtsH protease activity modulator HflK [Zetaproteobacteria bacterium CG17_big_fil_post_rev_8_21_14_2_50_50_13]PIV30167.1 MAG: FtsH protease activity modulator HflK [Zetaproteobacteria bacterium CG02_land_8_20_14_3_00_50_9]PIY54857.1 MAG: FtsH protease activity modulator HflK [Zetaproteobacteria bacterium CG_4_10_14_0_8_um_filter_49_80]PJA35217.1 MAG: FtsH protease activity modulator HflK [Zetaproteobacteria bacterium